MKRLQALMLLSAIVGCGDELPPASLVTDLRPVAAVVEVEGKDNIANPEPLDTVRVSLRVIDDGPTPPLQWSFVSCIPESNPIGPPLCRDVIAPCDGCEATPPADPNAQPIMRFEVPSEDALGDATTVSLQGVICAEGPPAGIDALVRFFLGETDEIRPCENEEDDGRFVVATIPVALSDNDFADNTNPEIVDVKLNGRAWPPPFDEGVPPEAANEGCGEGTSIDSLPFGIEVVVSDDSLQSYESDGMELIEEIQTSWLGNDGEFERSFSFIEDPSRSAFIDWALPLTADPSGTLVRFNFVIRDGRGGTDWAERGLCVTAP